MSPSLDDLLAALRADGDDSAAIEAKRASGGWPDDTARTLSAFANTPGGGTIVFGIDEASGFAPVGVWNAKDCRKALATTCRDALEPPVSATSQIETVDGHDIVVAEIQEAHATAKPVRVKKEGKAYLRQHDGDFALSENEEQAFLVSRTAPRFDAAVATEATIDDLDPELVDAYVAACHESSSALRRFDREETLFRTGVLAGDARRPSVAGLLALGLYPQQFFPNLVIQAHVRPGPNDPPGTRATDARRFDGPIPTMLSDAMAWIRRNTRSRVVFGDDGHGHDAPEYPAEAIRELLSNALVHRDLGEHALGLPVSLHLEATKLVLTNPGGLFGITADRLGLDGTTSARNGTLIRICQNVRFDGSRRVSEALASGIPTVLRALKHANMTPPVFVDQGIRFTVLVPNHTLLSAEDLAWLRSLGSSIDGLSDAQRHALVALHSGTVLTNRSFRELFPMDSRRAHAALSELVTRGFAVGDGERGARTYRFAGTEAPVAVPQPTLWTDDEAPTVARPSSSSNETQIREVLESGANDVNGIVAATGLTARQVRYALSKLRDRNEVRIQAGGRGLRTTYELSPADH